MVSESGMEYYPRENSKEIYVAPPPKLNIPKSSGGISYAKEYKIKKRWYRNPFYFEGRSSGRKYFCTEKYVEVKKPKTSEDF